MEKDNEEQFSANVMNLVDKAIKKAQASSFSLIKNPGVINFAACRFEYIFNDNRDVSPLGDKTFRTMYIEGIDVTDETYNIFKKTCEQENIMPSLHALTRFAIVIGFVNRLLGILKGKGYLETQIRLVAQIEHFSITKPADGRVGMNDLVLAVYERNNRPFSFSAIKPKNYPHDVDEFFRENKDPYCVKIVDTDKDDIYLFTISELVTFLVTYK